ncbi:hypothetical protein SAMN05421833_12934 [Microbispora rosea]|uniref:Uncharacterized protein n=1 Tax=Microbispora rosea TaxID=58117 RepID=A0A1N7GHV1_9ACTN|nr:hypothetical protein [Microbispora rosea]GIH51620.1 hypothetical protein Mro03_67990 [Microbispora rosea subsp. rosea]SIS12161.1 hypothetical protein SAMN05421833_12934 [Microbispora rosea]
MDGEHYDDPMREALGRAAGRTAQLTSLLAVAVQAGVDVARRRAEIAQARDLAARRELERQAHAVRQAARTRWAPAQDARWLGEADLLDVGRVWSTAVPHAADDPTAEAAVRKCEERLRTLHPQAMADYDRRRADGMSRLEAMRQAAPSFSRDARGPAPRRAAVTVGVGHEAVFDSFEHGPFREDWERARWERAAEQRAHGLLDELGACPGAAAPTDEELRSVLESRTNLPLQAVDVAVATRTSTAAALAALDHPHTIDQVVKSVVDNPAPSSTSPTRPLRHEASATTASPPAP